MGGNCGQDFLREGIPTFLYSLPLLRTDLPTPDPHLGTKSQCPVLLIVRTHHPPNDLFPNLCSPRGWSADVSLLHHPTTCRRGLRRSCKWRHWASSHPEHPRHMLNSILFSPPWLVLYLVLRAIWAGNSGVIGIGHGLESEGWARVSSLDCEPSARAGVVVV